MNACEFKASVSLYTLISPLSCIATHSYHVIFAFINNPFHATSVLLSYIMTLFVVVVIFQKTYYLVHNCFKRKQKSHNAEIVAGGEGAEATGNKTDKQKGEDCALATSFIAVIVLLAACIGLSIAVLIALPINNAIDLASTEIYAIYQASVTLFAALIAFQVIFRRKTSIFTLFIKAADQQAQRLKESDGDQEKWKKWEKCPRKRKKFIWEIYSFCILTLKHQNLSQLSQLRHHQLNLQIVIQRFRIDR